MADVSQLQSISIHAPRTGSDDNNGDDEPCVHAHFNPRSPHGERPKPWLKGMFAIPFQSTLPARGATANNGITADAGQYFNPRSPHGERRLILDQNHVQFLFQSTLPARGATAMRKRFMKRCEISIHAPRTGSDPACCAATITG